MKKIELRTIYNKTGEVASKLLSTNYGYMWSYDEYIIYKLLPNTTEIARCKTIFDVDIYCKQNGIY
ncbi:MAG: hypothetical protein QM660_10985 [Dysgonomonas sp.]